MSKTTRKTYSPQFKMKVALEVAKEQETLSQVAAKHGISPSLAASWRDELLAGADDIFGKAGTERERKEQEEAAALGWGREAMEGRLPGIPSQPQQIPEEGRRQSGAHAL